MNVVVAVAINLVGMLLIYSLMADAIIRSYWHGRGTMGVLGMIILVGLLWIVPSFVLNLETLDSLFWFGNWLVSSFGVVILCQSARWIPRELEDSARLDGCGWFGTYRHIVLPLVWRELGVIAFLSVMAASPLLLPPHPFLPTGSEESVSSTRLLLMMTAVSVVMTLPVMVIFFLSKRWFPRPARLGNE